MCARVCHFDKYLPRFFRTALHLGALLFNRMTCSCQIGRFAQAKVNTFFQAQAISFLPSPRESSVSRASAETTTEEILAKITQASQTLNEGREYELRGVTSCFPRP